VGAPFSNLVDGDAGGVAANNAAGLAHRFEAGHEFLLGPELLDDYFDNPVALGDAREVVLGVTQLDEAGAILARQVGRAGADHTLVTRADDAVARRRIVPLFRAEVRGHDVEQQHRDADVGEVGGNAATHRAGANDGHFLDLIAHGGLLGSVYFFVWAVAGCRPCRFCFSLLASSSNDCSRQWSDSRRISRLSPLSVTIR